MTILRDTRDRRTERWIRQVNAAIRLNASNLDLWRASLEVREFSGLASLDGIGRAMLARPHDDDTSGFAYIHRDAAETAQRVALGIRTPNGPLHLPYRFAGQDHRVYELEAARRRGWGACADASAAIAAAVLMVRGTCAICYERTPVLDTYAHARVSIGDTFVDAFPEQSLEVEACTALLPVTRESVSWPAHAEETAVRLLDAQRRAAIPQSSQADTTE